MNEFTIKAKEKLKETDSTLVFFNGDDLFTYNERGVKTLLSFVDSGKSFSGFSVADKVVGKAAAYLYVLLGVDELYADVISESALSVLEKNDIKVFFGIVVERIKNRTDTGFCPMETAVMDSENPKDAVCAIKQTLSTLTNGGK